MTQSRLVSFIEASANVVIGYLISVLANIIVLPVFGYHVTLGDSFAIGLVFTAISLVRGYVIRRLFEVQFNFLFKR